MLTLIVVVSLLLLCAYWALTANYGYWKKRGVPSPPVSLLFGNLGASFSLAKSLGQIFTDIYNDHPNLLYVGYYKIRTPSILVRDPDLIKDVLVKHFSSFHDNDIMADEEVDPVGSKNPFALKGQQWKIVKNQLTPCFTTKKLKSMYPLIEDAARKLLNYVEAEPEATGSSGLDTKELSAKYATEVVASCAFGLEGRSFDEADPEFRRMGKKIFQPSTTTVIKILLLTVIPSLANFLKVSLFPKDVIKYFTNVVLVALKYREENGIVRNDFLDFMKELKAKPGEYDFTDVDVVAHAMGFFTDGFETSSSVMTHILYDLAANSDCQEKLRHEIRETLKKAGGKFDYDVINGMQYLDAVVCESLRMHPPGLALSRVCTKAFTLPPPGGVGTGPEVEIEIGTPVAIPIYGVQLDPKYFPDPKRYDPERFSTANRESITKCTYLPFGEGPRGCYGQRFALMQVKLAVASLVAKFTIKVSNKTRTPLEVDPACLVLHYKGGIWLNFLKISN